jgi:hypothetical protein
MKSYQEAFNEGQEAVRQRPYHAPSNPYSEFKEGEEDAHNGWSDGAIEAGICEIYTNGVLDKEHRK